MVSNFVNIGFGLINSKFNLITNFTYCRDNNDMVYLSLW